jgi:hypothetical protein
MADRSRKDRASRVKAAKRAANDDLSPGPVREPDPTPVGSPANDNPSIDGLPTCLEVTDDEVRLLHRYLGREILALFG